MRILVSTPTFLPTVGGAELGIHEIYHRLGREHEVRIVAPLPRMGSSEVVDQSSPHYEFQPLLPELDRFRPTKLARAARLSPLAYAFELERQAEQFKPDVINPHFIVRNGGAASFVGQRQRVPVALSLVGRPDVIHRHGPLYKRYSTRLLDRADLIFTISDYLLEGEPERPHVQKIPYGVDLEAYSPSARSDSVREGLALDPEDIAVLTVQRLAAVKRVDALLYAHRAAVAVNPRLVLVVVGKGPESESLKRLAADLGIEKSVRFAGYVSEADLPGVYASCDVFAFHSLHETFGIVFAQAMACGLPIVAAATSCVPEIVDKAGILVPPFDIAGFAEAIESLANDALGRRTLSVANRERAVRECGWDRIAEQYDEAFSSLVRA